MRKILFAGFIALFSFGSVPAASASQWPERPVRLIVGFGAGGGNDVVARLLASELSPILGQKVVVENRTGAGGIIGTEAVVRAEPDGYTLMLGTSSQLVMNAALYKKLSFDITGDLIPVALISRTPMTMLINTDMGVTNLDEFIALAKKQPGKLNYGGLGPGSVTHVAMELFLKAADISMQAVHYRAQTAAFQSLVGGDIHAVLDATPTFAAELVASGKAYAIAQTFKAEGARSGPPSFREAGLGSAESYTWNSIMAPRGTPSDVVAKLNDAVNQALKTPRMTEFFDKNGIDGLGGSTPASADAFWRKELAHWVPAIQAMGLSLD